MNTTDQENTRKIRLHPEWLSQLEDEFRKPYMKNLRTFLLEEKKKGKTLYPPGNLIFNALNCTPFSKLKVVILGQDPYHNPHQAHGLAFSVQPGIAIPPSLINIYQELSDDLNIPPASHGHLHSWTEQGVLLLNSVLTVEKNRPGSHQKQGWEEFTDRIIQIINTKHSGAIFILWGAYAQHKGDFINRNKHLIISSPHPSPLSASRGFFGSRPFSRTNTWLQQKKITSINWQLPETARKISQPPIK